MTVHCMVQHYLKGAVDLSLPDPLLPWQGGLDAIETVQAGEADGFKAVLVNDHREPLAPIVAFLASNEMFRPPITVKSGLVLNEELGGINPFAAEHSLMLGARLIAMPTLSSMNYRRKFRRALARGANLPDPAPRHNISIVNERMQILSEINEILDLVVSHDAVLDAGYIHLNELLELLGEAKRHGVSRVLVRDPDRYAGTYPSEIGMLVDAGATLGFTIGAEEDIERFMAYREVPPDRIMLLMPTHAGEPTKRLSAAAQFVDRIAGDGYGDPHLRALLSETGQWFLGV